MALQRMRAKSPLLQAIHEAAVSLKAHDFIDEHRLRVYQTLCLVPVPTSRNSQLKTLRAPRV